MLAGLQEQRRCYQKSVVIVYIVFKSSYLRICQRVWESRNSIRADNTCRFVLLLCFLCPSLGNSQFLRMRAGTLHQNTIPLHTDEGNVAESADKEYARCNPIPPQSSLARGFCNRYLDRNQERPNQTKRKRYVKGSENNFE